MIRSIFASATALVLFASSLSLFSEQTFSMIKPGAVQEHHIGAIIDAIEKANLQIVKLQMMQLDEAQVKAFYKEHEGKPFFPTLITKMTSGPVVAMVIEGDNAVPRLREIIGNTNPEKAAPGTIRALFGKNMTENAIHASDSADSAKREIAFFFKIPSPQ